MMDFFLRQMLILLRAHTGATVLIYHICTKSLNLIHVTFPCFTDLFRNATIESVSASHTLIGCADTKLIAYWPKAVTRSAVYVNRGGICEYEHGSSCRGRCGCSHPLVPLTVTMLLSVGIISLALVVLIIKYLFGSSGPNPFEKDTRVPLKPIVHDRKEKNKVLKQGELKSNAVVS